MDKKLLDTLKVRLTELKDRELKLEIILAVRKYPEFRDALVDIALSLNEIKLASTQAKFLGKKGGTEVNKLLKLRDFYAAKLEYFKEKSLPRSSKLFTTYKTKLAEVDEALKNDCCDKKDLRVYANLHKAKQGLKQKLAKYSALFETAQVDISRVLVSIVKYLE